MIKSEIFKNNICLETEELKLRPSELSDVGLFAEISSPSIWEFMSYDLENISDWQKFISNSIENRKNQVAQEFAIIQKPTNKLIGATSICSISEFDKKVEIGLTWFSESYQGKGINQKVKLILLSFLFDQIKVNKVEFRTRGGNLKSQRALDKIGAVKEGILRELIFRNGKYIDVVYYGILASEWKNIKEGLLKINTGANNV
ncbi:GNAT family N-acetyltransferase [Tamlana sp. 62-3]|uniref:GNAT family N-acetyltransferase n=1 Tax=Neotamlana sargassicola TaxID=2883125 RepID=A0A9X1I9D1_9FLAO|nr:GNAT family protein [Tamlana sargassicola]MCB4809682.1 GNAT family N-acetyltransferase [Tamlana sargassicola]